MVIGQGGTEALVGLPFWHPQPPHIVLSNLVIKQYTYQHHNSQIDSISTMEKERKKGKGGAGVDPDEH